MPDPVAVMITAHAPQLIAPPPTEDPEQVRLTVEAMQQLGRRLDETHPDALVLVVNDHLEGFFLNCVAPFTVYLGEHAEGTFAGQTWSYPVATDLAMSILEQGQAAGFDLAFSQEAEFDHASLVPLHYVLGSRPIPIVPVFVNVYIPPQPSPRRCFAFGQALGAILRGRPERLAVLASGGMSHFPGTDRYGNPDFEFDQRMMAALKAGHGRELLDCSAVQLDNSGNVELRTWIVTLGIVGERTPLDIITYQPSWHHGYAVGEWLARTPAGAAA
jgi:2,3-dihydroxyphenylpropionate 1,2-dioxygenase